MTFERDFKCRSAMLCAEPFAKASEPLFFLLAAKRISADRREHLCHHGCLREIALLFAPIYFFSAYGEAKRISEKLGFAEIRYRLCLGFALGRGSCVKLRCRTGKDRSSYTISSWRKLKLREISTPRALAFHFE